MSEENIESQNSAEPEPTPSNVSNPALEAFIFEPDEFRDEIVPRRLSPPEVARFLLQRIGRDTDLRAFVQVEKVADFYDTTEIVDKFKQFLDKKESGSEEVRRSIVIARIIAFLGDPEDVEFARQYYRHLIAKIDTVEDFEEIIFLHEDLGLGASSGELRQKLQTKLAALEPKKEADYQSRLEYLKFQESIEQKLRSAEQVQPIKDRILKLSDRNQRLQEEIRMYATSEYGFPQYLQQWSARRIRRETWAAQPAEQIKRNHLPLKDDVVKALRAFLDRLREMPNLENDEKDAARLRLLRAIRFFDGRVSPEEEGILRQHKGKQVDILANEGFLLP